MSAIASAAVPDATIVIQAHGIAGRAAILQGFDRLRCEVAASASGSPSVFLGYDTLEFNGTASPDGSVILHAEVVATGGRRQTVRYTATDASAGQRAGSLCEGRGVTALRA